LRKILSKIGHLVAPGQLSRRPRSFEAIGIGADLIKPAFQGQHSRVRRPELADLASEKPWPSIAKAYPELNRSKSWRFHGLVHTATGGGNSISTAAEMAKALHARVAGRPWLRPLLAPNRNLLGTRPVTACATCLN